jgi:hypothetical protein
MPNISVIEMTPRQLKIAYILILATAIIIAAFIAYNMYNQLNWESIAKVAG